MEFFDTHTHLMYPDFGDLSGVIDRAKAVGVSHYVVPGLDLSSSKATIELSERFSGIIPAIGLHPSSLDEDLSPFGVLASDARIKAIGEIGLDHGASPMLEQEKRFRVFLDLAVQTNKPALIHMRETWADGFRILGEYPQLRGQAVIHCFTGGEAEAGQIRDLGLLVSVTAIVARSGMGQTLEVLKAWPLEQMMLETDGPYLSWPGNKWPNEPSTVAQIAQFVADLKGINVESVATITTATARRFFAVE